MTGLVGLVMRALVDRVTQVLVALVQIVRVFVNERGSS